MMDGWLQIVSLQLFVACLDLPADRPVETSVMKVRWIPDRGSSDNEADAFAYSVEFEFC